MTNPVGTSVRVAGVATVAAVLLGMGPPPGWAPLELLAPLGRAYKPADIKAAKLNLQRLHKIFQRDKALDPPPRGLPL
jgi:hypothetical protein